MVPLIAVAHGSRDPRSSRVVAAAISAIRERRPDLDVRLCFLDLNAPSVEQVLDTVATEGHTRAIAVPLLLGSAFHARVDLPALLGAARIRHPQLNVLQAEVLGQDGRLLEAVRDRILEVGATQEDTGLGVALAAVGSSDPRANDRTALLARAIAEGTDWAGVRICFATSAEPGVVQAISQLRQAGASRIVLAPWFLAPGLLTDRVGRAATACAPDLRCAATIGAHRQLVEVVLDRYTQALNENRSPLARSA